MKSFLRSGRRVRPRSSECQSWVAGTPHAPHSEAAYPSVGRWSRPLWVVVGCVWEASAVREPSVLCSVPMRVRLHTDTCPQCALSFRVHSSVRLLFPCDSRLRTQARVLTLPRSMRLSIHRLPRNPPLFLRSAPVPPSPSPFSAFPLFNPALNPPAIRPRSGPQSTPNPGLNPRLNPAVVPRVLHFAASRIS